MAEKVIVLTGLGDTLTALKAFDKQAVKEFEKVINTELGKAKDDARRLVDSKPPMSGWRTTDPFKPSKASRGGAGWPAWDYGAIVAGIGTTKAQRKVRRDYTTSAGSLKNGYSSGAIFEVAGRLKHLHSKSGEQFIKNLNDRFGKGSRLIWSVVDKDGYKIRKNVYEALEKAKKRLQEQLDQQRS
jgi:hypothetical protein